MKKLKDFRRAPPSEEDDDTGVKLKHGASSESRVGVSSSSLKKQKRGDGSHALVRHDAPVRHLHYQQEYQQQVYSSLELAETGENKILLDSVQVGYDFGGVIEGAITLTGGVLSHVKWSIRQLWVSSIISLDATITAHDQ